MEPPDFHIRPYREADCEAVVNLNRLVLTQAGAHIRAGNWDHDVKNVKAEFIGTGGTFLVGEKAGQVIAMGALTRVDNSTAKLRRMRIHPDCQRQGFGRMMLEQLETRALELGFVRVILDTSIRLTGAQQFYPKHGYVMTHEERQESDRLMYFEKLLTPLSSPES